MAESQALQYSCDHSHTEKMQGEHGQRHLPLGGIRKYSQRESKITLGSGIALFSWGEQ